MNTDLIWFVARVKWQREKWAAENIRRQGFQSYLPRVRVNDRVSAFLFPGYMFVGTDGRWRCLCGTFGLLGVVMRGAEPALMPVSEILALRKREDREGLVQLPERPRFRRGQMVRVSTGVFAGKLGVYQGASSGERERILLEFLGDHTSVLIASENLAAA